MTVSNFDIVQASARFRNADGNDVVNVYNFFCDFAADQTDQDVFDAVDAYLTSVYTEFDANLDADFQPFDLKVDIVEFLGGAWKVVQNVGFGTWGSGISPTASGDALPPGVAVLIKLFTGLGKRTGRKFVGGVVEAVCDSDGQVVSAALASFVAGFVKLVTPHVISAGNELVTMILGQADGATRNVTEIAVSDVFAYQRRRRPGTGS